MINIQSKALPSFLRSIDPWIVYLHILAFPEKGRVNEDTVAHTNVRGAGSTTDLQLSRPQQRLLCANFISDGDEDEDDDVEDDYLQDEEATPIQNPDIQLTQAELTTTQRLPRPSKGQTPLSIDTIKNRFKDVVRWLLILGIDTPSEVISSIDRIIEHLAREGYYPSGQLKKYWVDDDTVAGIVTGVWTILSHDASSTGSRSVANLLFLQTMQLLDQRGSRDITWVDMTCQPVMPNPNLILDQCPDSAELRELGDEEVKRR